MASPAQTWPGVTQLPDYKPTFPQWKALDLADAVKNVSCLDTRSDCRYKRETFAERSRWLCLNFKWCAGDSSCFGLAGTVFEVTLIGSSKVKFNKAHPLDALQPFRTPRYASVFQVWSLKENERKSCAWTPLLQVKVINYFERKILTNYCKI